MLTRCRRLLSDDGMIFVHIDYRAHPHVRLLLDELFGEENLLNEIIWVYQSGGLLPGLHSGKKRRPPAGGAARLRRADEHG